jgi:hypothetical protein
VTVSFPPREPPYEPPYGQPPYGQPPYGPMPGQPYFGPPPQWVPEKKPIWKKTWFRVVAALFVLGVINSATSDGDKTQETGTAEAAPAPTVVDSAAPTEEAVEEVVEEAAPEPAPPGIGQPAADGDFSFVVQAIDCSLTEMGGEYLGTTAQGRFCVVSLTVTNIGNSAQTFDGDNATLLNAAGQEFSADSGAAFYLEDSSSFYEEINPGNTLNSKVVFDVPAGTTPTAIELHDSMFSGGVTVALQ